MPATVIVGAQWGDEGKGKIVDLLAQHSDVVCRYQGGPNAGHTIVRDGETFKLHHVPSGILYEGKVCVIGPGCVVDPGLLVRELDELESRGISTADLRVSGNAHVIMPWHVAIDSASERRLGQLQIGTTRRGIGPAYADKSSRIGIRLQDMLDAKILRQKFETALAEKNEILVRVYGAPALEVEELAEEVEALAGRLRPYVADTSLLVERALGDGQTGPARGRAGDAPRPRPRHVSVRHLVEPDRGRGGDGNRDRPDPDRHGRRASPRRTSRASARGPFPTEIEGDDHARVRELGAEYGTTTGRERRCGWLDLVALRYAVRVNGLTSLAMTKLDVLSDFAELPVCVRYRLPDGTETSEFPAHQSDFHHARPVYETLPGWEEPLDEVGGLHDLPPSARRYVDYVADALGVEVCMVGTGPDRERILTSRGLAAVAGA